MANAFEQGTRTSNERAEKLAERQFNRIYKKLLHEVHADKFHGKNSENGGGKFEQEAIDLTQELNNIRDLNEKGVSWSELLEKLKNFRVKVEEFSQRVAAENGTADKEKDKGDAKKNPDDEKMKNPDGEPDDSAENKTGARPEQGPEPEPESEPEPEKAEAERRKLEREQNLLRLEEELNISRMDLAQMDLKKGKLWQRVVGFFKKDVGQFGEDRDVEFLRTQYEESLSRYKEAFLEEAKMGAITEDEIGYIFEYFDKDEKAKLYDSRTEARLENVKGTKFEWIREQCAKGVNWYIEMKPPKKKLALSIILGGGAAAAAIAASFGVAGAGTVAGMLGVANTLRRFFGGAAVGVASDAYLDKKGEERRAKESDEKIAGLKDGIENFSVEEKVDRLKEWLKNNEKEVSADLQKRKLGSLFKKSSAVFVGYLIGSGELFRGIKNVAGFISDSTGISDFVGEKFDALKGVDFKHWIMEKLNLEGSNGYLPKDLEYLRGNNSWSGEYDPTTGQPIIAGPEQINVPEITIAKGSSLEGSLIDYLNNHPDLIEKYNQLNGGRGFDSGQIAHRMALDYLDPQNPEDLSRHLIHPGATVDIDLETMKIVNVQDQAGMGYSAENNTPTGSGVVPESVDASPDDVFTEPTPEMSRGEITRGLFDRFHMWSGTYDKVSYRSMSDFLSLGEKSSYMTGTPWENYDQGDFADLQKNLQGFYDKLPAGLQEKASHMSLEKFINTFDEDLFSSVRDNIIVDGKEIPYHFFKSSVSDIYQQLTDNNIELWNGIRNLPLDEDMLTQEKVSAIRNAYVENFGADANPVAGEKMQVWLHRLAKMALARKGEILNL